MVNIAVLDGQGGGIGKALVEMLKERFGESVKIIALGTNSMATVAMLKAGADVGATGENAIVVNASKVDIITGPLGIIAPNSMMGELTADMAKAVAESAAAKVLVPVNRCSIFVAGVEDVPFAKHMENAVEIISGIVSGPSGKQGSRTE